MNFEQMEYEQKEFEQWLEDNPGCKNWRESAARHYFKKRHETKKGMVFKSHRNYDEVLKKEGKHLKKKGKSTNRPSKMSNVREQHIRLGLGFVKNHDRLKQNANKTMLNIFLRNSVPMRI